MARPAPDQDWPETGPDAPADRAQPDYFDQALFDLRYHLLAVRTEPLQPLPNLEDYGVTVDRFGNVTRTHLPPVRDT